jgi:flagellar biosynthesis protein FlhF
MKLVAITAENANAALAQVYEQLGADAVVVSVKKMPGDGISRFWQNGRRIEVTACVPETPEAKAGARESRAGRQSSSPDLDGRDNLSAFEAPAGKMDTGRWRSIAWLEANGLLPALTRQLEENVRSLHGGEPPATAEQEWAAVSGLIINQWRPARQLMAGTGRPHVFIGPAGSGKTTALCKWMTAAVLLEEQSVRVWRLDGDRANGSELLTLHCELTGVPVERFWTGPDGSADLQFVDLPGLEIQDSGALAALRGQLSALPEPHIHLVLNAAYENAVLFGQFHAFESFLPEDIIFTHLDEERRRVKLWNFIMGTNCPVSFLGAGQKIPGEFRRAEPALLFPQKNCR